MQKLVKKNAADCSKVVKHFTTSGKACFVGSSQDWKKRCEGVWAYNNEAPRLDGLGVC